MAPGSVPPSTAPLWWLVVELSLALLGKEWTAVTLGPFPSAGDASLLPQPSSAHLPCKCTSNIFGSTAFLEMMVGKDQSKDTVWGYKNDK